MLLSFRMSTSFLDVTNFLISGINNNGELIQVHGNVMPYICCMGLDK